jgi:glycosyltransferase involved in cell wall biosynthesis
VAVLLPCRNEEATIASVVRDFRHALPDASIYVYDNASVDDTAEAAKAAGAVVREAPLPGKGNVLRRMFADIDASVYVLADGDSTYDAAAAPTLVERLRSQNLDMVVGRRVAVDDPANCFRRGHRTGNLLLTKSVHWLFGDGSEDMLSGYRVFSRRYVKSFPASSRGFEAETEMTVHALDLSLPFDEVPTIYRERPRESASKLRTIPDGLRILKFILVLCKDYRPLRFFGCLAMLAGLVGVVAGASAGGARRPWAPETVLSVVSAMLIMVFLLAGLILDSLGRSRRELKRMLYLTLADLPTVGRPEL